jgi:hypothetical protein
MNTHNILTIKKKIAPLFSTQGRSEVREPVPPPSQTGGIKSRRRIAIRRYTCAT